MILSPLTEDDLPQVGNLQPDGWPSITPSLQFYLQSTFCHPIKLSIDEQVVGVGATIVHHHTSWLAHIIVNPLYRKQGIGAQITKALIQIAERYNSKTILLIATTLGEPVYTKLGFQKEQDYIFLQNGKIEKPLDQVVHPFHEKYREQILMLDRSISGEDRHQLLLEHLPNARLIVTHERVEGVFLPSLGEGLVLAENTETGLALLTERLSPEKNRIALPVQNSATIEFLKMNGYSEFLRGSRMFRGEKLAWQPSKIFSRIGGNLG